MSQKEIRKGEIIILIEALLWGFFPVITKLSYGALQPLYSLAWTSVFATIFFGILLAVKKKGKELADLGVWQDSVYIALLIGVIFYGLFFFGLKYTTAGNAALVGLIEVFFNFIFFQIYKGHPLQRTYVYGALLMVFGAVVVLVPKSSGIHTGDWIIAASYFFTPLGNWFQQRSRRRVSSEIIMFERSLISVPFLFVLAWLFGQSGTWQQLRSSLVLLLINGFVLFGLCKLLWIEAIHRLPITKTSALSSMSPLLTLVFSFWLLHEAPLWWQLVSFVPSFFGILLLTSRQKHPAVAMVKAKGMASG